MRPRRAFSRMETDAELLARCSPVPGFPAHQRPGETVDERADRAGLRRRIVWDEA